MRILVTGAAGYIGSALARFLSARKLHVLATDQSAPATVIGNIAYPQFARSLVTAEVGAIFHLASLVSGGAEQNFELGTKVNLDATRDLLEACRLAGHRPKFIFASSIAVYRGVDLVTDDTPPDPGISYGAQKLICDILIDDYTRRGYIDGRALRVPTVMVRPGGANTAVSGWASALVREPLAGRDYICPVRPDTRLPCISLRKAVECFYRAFELPEGKLSSKRAILLNGIAVSARQMRDAAGGPGKVRFQADAGVQNLMDVGPKETRSQRAAELGFPSSRSIQEIVDEYKEDHPDPALARHG